VFCRATLVKVADCHDIVDDLSNTMGDESQFIFHTEPLQRLDESDYISCGSLPQLL